MAAEASSSLSRRISMTRRWELECSSGEKVGLFAGRYSGNRRPDLNRTPHALHSVPRPVGPSLHCGVSVEPQCTQLLFFFFFCFGFFAFAFAAGAGDGEGEGWWFLLGGGLTGAAAAASTSAAMVSTDGNASLFESHSSSSSSSPSPCPPPPTIAASKPCKNHTKNQNFQPYGNPAPPPWTLGLERKTYRVVKEAVQAGARVAGQLPGQRRRVLITNHVRRRRAVQQRAHRPEPDAARVAEGALPHRPRPPLRRLHRVAVQAPPRPLRRPLARRPRDKEMEFLFDFSWHLYLIP
uniref:Uncharacterized protein n=1 Tax=Oryza brachyantha TaxID=4533 RepID=J3LJY2_ORYBR